MYSQESRAFSSDCNSAPKDSIKMLIVAIAVFYSLFCVAMCVYFEVLSMFTKKVMNV